MPSLGDLWGLIKKVDRLLELEEKQGKASVAMQEQLDALVERVNRVEAREEIVVAKAQAAAGMAAMASLSDLSRRLGGLEERSAAVPASRARRVKGEPDA